MRAKLTVEIFLDSAIWPVGTVGTINEIEDDEFDYEFVPDNLAVGEEEFLVSMDEVEILTDVDEGAQDE